MIGICVEIAICSYSGHLMKEKSAFTLTWGGDFLLVMCSINAFVFVARMLELM